MTTFQSIILGIIQGCTEFIPISSSGHLVLAREFFGWEDPGLLYDAILHLGTLVAAILYFWKDLKNIALCLFRNIADAEYAQDRGKGLFVNIMIATIPAAIAGFLFEDLVDNAFRNVLSTSIFLVVLGLLFFGVEYFARKQRVGIGKDIFSLSMSDAAFIGVFQIISLLPGISRSGITIASGLFRGIRRSDATRFAFLLSIPIIAGAGFHSLIKYFMNPSNGISGMDVALGFFAAAIVGYGSIFFMMRYLKTQTLQLFAVYVIALGGILLLKGVL